MQLACRRTLRRGTWLWHVCVCFLFPSSLPGFGNMQSFEAFSLKKTCTARSTSAVPDPVTALIVVLPTAPFYPTQKQLEKLGPAPAAAAAAPAAAAPAAAAPPQLPPDWAVAHDANGKVRMRLHLTAAWLVPQSPSCCCLTASRALLPAYPCGFSDNRVTTVMLLLLLVAVRMQLMLMMLCNAMA